MLNANSLPNGTSLDCDVCIVGAGAAGISVALELANTKARVIVVESGGLSFNKRIQNLTRGDTVAEPYHIPLHLSRYRIIGGTTSVWGGRCVPLDRIDFERRSYIPHSGWPISFDDLAPFYQRANQICEAGIFDYTVTGSLGDGASPMIPHFNSDVIQSNSIERFSPPTHFGRRYLPLLQNAPNIELVHHATCTSIDLNSVGKVVERLDFRTLSLHKFSVRAKNYVLATGCLEATRLLLASSDVMPEGIGNHSGRLGKFYMSHIEGALGLLDLSQCDGHIIYNYERTSEKIYVRRRLAIEPSTQRRYKLGNLIARLSRPTITDPRHGNSLLSAIYLTKQYLLPKQAAYLTSVERTHQHAAQERLGNSFLLHHLKNVATNLPQLAAFAHIWIHRRMFAKRKLPPIIVSNPNSSFHLDVNAEQVPDQSNRMTLTNEKDPLGLRKIRVYWKINDLDVHTIRSSLHVLRREFNASGCGELSLKENSLNEQIHNCTPVGGHHMGTARMSSSPAHGVVNPDCQVHGLPNLFVSGSAVFPTSGHANPTLTVVALAIRLAQHLKAGLNH